MNEIYSIDLKELMLLQDKEEYIFLNFPYPESLKIISFYEKIKKGERNTLIQLFKQLTGIDIRTDDILGKLHIDLLQILTVEKKDIIILTNKGFPPKSINFLVENFKNVFKNLDTLRNKKIIIVECEVNNPENDKYFEKYFYK